MTIKDHKVLVIQDFMTSFFEVFSPVFLKLQPNYAKKLWGFVYGIFVNLYLQMIIAMSQKWKPEELPALLNKMDAEVEIIKDVFSGKVTKSFCQENEAKFLMLRNAFAIEKSEIFGPLCELKVLLQDRFMEKSMVI